MLTTFSASPDGVTWTNLRFENPQPAAGSSRLTVVVNADGELVVDNLNLMPCPL